MLHVADTTANVRLVLMTPDRAQKILSTHEALEKEHNCPLQRPVSPKNVEKITSAVGSPDWCLPVTNVTISERGRILNGQHTLRAIIKANLSEQVVFFSGVSEADEVKVYALFDSQKKRSGPDILYSLGFDQDRGMLSAMAGWINAYTETGKFSTSPSLIDVGDVAEEYRELFAEAIVFAKAFTKELWADYNEKEGTTKLFFKNHFAFWYALMRIKGLGTVEINEFFDALKERHTATDIFYRYLIEHRGSGGAASRGITTVIFKAWEFYQKGTNTKSLQLRHLLPKYEDLTVLNFA